MKIYRCCLLGVLVAVGAGCDPYRGDLDSLLRPHDPATDPSQAGGSPHSGDGGNGASGDWGSSMGGHGGFGNDGGGGYGAEGGDWGGSMGGNGGFGNEGGGTGGFGGSGAEGGPSGQAEVEARCSGGEGSQVQMYQASEPNRVDIISVYQGGAYGGNRIPARGDIKVSIDNADTAVLVLSAYESTIWHVGGRGMQSLRKVILTGYHPQEVITEGGVVVERHFGNDWWESNGGENAKSKLVMMTAEATATMPTTLATCHEGQFFSLQRTN